MNGAVTAFDYDYGLSDLDIYPKPGASGTTTSDVLSREHILPTGAGQTIAKRPRSIRILAGRGVSVNQVVVKKTIEALYSLAFLPPGWNSYRAKAIRPDVIQATVEFASNLLKANTPAPQVVPTVRGGVQLEWHLSNIDIEVHVDSPDAARFYAEDLATGTSQDLPLVGNEAVLSAWLNRISH